MQRFIEPARAARICISAKTTQWMTAMRKYQSFADVAVNGSNRSEAGVRWPNAIETSRSQRPIEHRCGTLGVWVTNSAGPDQMVPMKGLGKIEATFQQYQ